MLSLMDEYKMNNQDSVTVRYNLSLSDLNKALHAYVRSERSYADLIIGTVAIIFGLLQFYFSGLTTLGLGLLALGVFILAKGYVLIASPLLHRRYRDTYENEFDVIVDNDGVHASIGALDATRSWDGYNLVIENENSFIFIYAKMGFFAIPKRALSSEVVSRLRSIVESNAPSFRSLVAKI
jgi:hypothetical protein